MSLLTQFPPTPPGTAKASRKGSINGLFQEDMFDSIPKPTNHNINNYPLPPKYEPKNVLPQDLKTPDGHVERDARLIRLTGLHPFNSEAPLSDLYNEGFITSENLHYVRNHGAVPKCEDGDIDNWTFAVEGMVDNPFTVSVKELIESYPQFTYPVTLVCAGNRRKEQNVMRKTKGFSWGPAGVSTALWTGVPVRELLARARPNRGARYVCMEGADKLPNGYYGTSIKLNWCMDPNRGVLVAHKMNGRVLHPDHGKPVRIIIPGQIGGRSVKWLKKIIVTCEPSENWYHIYDNRVLPTMITPEASTDLPAIWKDERYAIYDLNANSVISFPAHDEHVSLIGGPGSYKVRGYAYGGGGKRITRIEVTLDQGKTWSMAKLKYPEDDYRLAPDGHSLFGGQVDMWWRETSFCWCFWELDIATDDLQNADDIMVRAMDEGLMIQPRDMYWSVLGMMNNPWFRVVIHKDEDGLRFEHPTQPALISGGWMERVKKSGGNLANGFWGEALATDQGEIASQEEPSKEICMKNDKITHIVSREELEKHDDEKNPWFVVNGQVYDGTPFLEGHPGGAASIIGAAGQDVSEEFLTIHSENAKAMMPMYHIGSIDEAARRMLAGGDEIASHDSTPREVFLQPKAWNKAILQNKTKISSDTKIFTFMLDHEEQIIGLPVGQHLMIRLRDPATREAIIRAYTPMSVGTDKGKLDVLIKIYYDEPSGRKGGRMTQALDAIPIGHFVDIKGPVGRFEYQSAGICVISGKQRRVRRLIMICGGSGITPIFQVLRAVLQNPQDPTKCVVLNGNRFEDDILCRTELDFMAAAMPNTRCRLVYTLSQPTDDWKGRRGRMDKDLFEEEIGSCKQVGGEDLVLICGPSAMEESVHKILLNLGWQDQDIIIF